ncbi:aminodeoxychorismate/anthranilate synthase component II [bacterium]|nr:aminodeoxychorismate/anthranilate synthase component II [bacterium]
MRRVLLVDHDDSFTRNVAGWLRRAGARVRVRRKPSEAEFRAADALVLGPGPGGPAAREESLAMLSRWPAGQPLLGVCLGCQLLAHWAGHAVVPGSPRHGEAVGCFHQGGGLFAALPSPFPAPRYNSLSLAPGPLPSPLEETGADEDGSTLALRVAGRPWHGLLFHPDSFLCPEAGPLAAAFLA